MTTSASTASATSPATSRGTESTDVVIVGGGHNALVAAAYLAGAGQRVVLLERLDLTGGAAISAEAFAGLPARLSRYSYLVSLMPEQIIRDLRLDLELRSRTTASYTPLHRDGRDTALLVERTEGASTRESFLEVTGSEAEYAAWQQFYAELADLAQVVLPSVLDPLRRASALRERMPASIWRDVVERPIGDSIGDRFSDDDIAGVIGTDALIGTFNSLHDPSLVQNRCFLYHLIGNGTGEWRVPVGGMGAVTDALAASARAAGADLRTGCEVSAIDADDAGCEVRYTVDGQERVIAAGHVLCGAAPEVLDRLRGRTPATTTPGAQLKINLLLTRLPRLRSGVDPRLAWAGTFHLDEGHAQLEHAYARAAAGELPPASGEFYCHSLTDPSILGPDLAAKGWHTLTYFGLHTPPAVFADDPVGLKERGVEEALDALDAHLEEPVRDCLATDAEGRPCVEAKTPLDLQEALHMPGGHIFHGDLQWPWLDDGVEPGTAAEAWGVATPDARVLMCGAGARRGGAVSGIGGHNAAHALLQELRG